MKNFENYNSNNINIGDYVICSDKFFNTQINYVNYDLEKYHNFLNNNIGKIVDKEKDDNRFIVKYNNIPVTIKPFFQKDNTTVFNEYEIIYNSKIKEDLELYINIKKYNL